MADFKQVPIDPKKVEDALVAYGVAGLVIREASPKEKHFSGTHDGGALRMKLFLNNDGRCSLGRFTGDAEAPFKALAEHVCKTCSWGEKPRLEYSLQKQSNAVFAELVSALETKGATVTERKVEKYAETVKVRGPLGDQLSVKLHTNGTLQLQGTHAQLGAWAVDHLQGTMGLEEMLTEQRKIYALPLTVQQVRDELVARIPHVHDKLADEVRREFSSAHAMTKISIPLEDYAGVAFYALRGLEGFCMQLLTDDCRLKPPQIAKLSQYFEPVFGAPGQFKMASPASDGVAAILQKLLSDCYTTWNKQRHRLFHMDGSVETSRIIEDREDAVALVEEVFHLIDTGYADLLKNSH